MDELIELKDLLTKIQEHNNELYVNTPKNKPVPFWNMRLNWGTKVIPQKFWLKKGDKVMTRNGKKAFIENITLYNSNDNEVTFPVKGYYLHRREGNKPKKVRCIWTIDGRSDVTKIENDLDLIRC